MKKEKIIDKLNFYIGFLDSFIERGSKFLKGKDYISLKLTREWIIEAIKKLENKSN